MTWQRIGPSNKYPVVNKLLFYDDKENKTNAGYVLVTLQIKKKNLNYTRISSSSDTLKVFTNSLVIKLI